MYIDLYGYRPLADYKPTHTRQNTFLVTQPVVEKKDQSVGTDGYVLPRQTLAYLLVFFFRLCALWT